MTSAATKYFISDTNGLFINWYSNIIDLETDGQYLELRGNSGADEIFVGEGTQVDATVLGLSADAMYLTGNFGDYTQSGGDASNEYTFSRSIGGNTESITFASVFGEQDMLYFADGNLDVGFNNLFDMGTSSFKPINSAMLSGSGTPEPLSVPVQESGTTKVYVTDTSGENIPSFYRGSVLSVRGNSGVDTVYVSEGTQVDATVLGLSADAMYLTGNFGDYTKSGGGASNEYTFSRSIGGNTESITFASVFGEQDLLYFADGNLDVGFNNLFDMGTSSFKPINSAMLSGSGTPGLVPVITAINSISTLVKGGENIVFTLTLSEAVTITGGPPTIDVTINGQSLNDIEYVSGSETKILTFTAVAAPLTGDGNNITLNTFNSAGATITGDDTSQPMVTTAGQTMTSLTVDNTDPVVTTTTFTADENGTIVGTLVGTDDNDIASWSISGTDADIFNIDDSTGVLTFNLAKDFETPDDDGIDGTYDITVTATDNVGHTADKAITVVLNNVNEAPELAGEINDQTWITGQSLSHDISSNFRDPDTGYILSYSLSDNPSWMSINTGIITGTPTDVASADSVTVTATDADGLSVSDSFVIQVIQPQPLLISVNPIATDNIIDETEDDNNVTISGDLSTDINVAEVNISLNNEIYQATLDGVQWGTVVSSNNIKAISPGTNSVVIEAKDSEDSSLGQVTTNITYEVQPQITINDVSTDNVITLVEDDLDITISGTTTNVEDGQTVSLNLNEQALTTTTVSGNTWTATLPAANAQSLTQGDHTLTADVSNIGGTLAPQASKTITHDTTAPGISIDDVAIDNIINSTKENSNITISGTTTNVDDDQTVTVVISSNFYTTTVTSNAWSVTMLAAEAQNLPEGIKEIYADVTDQNGVAAPQAVKTITHDTTAVITFNTVASDNIIDATEDDSGVIISGLTSGIEDGTSLTVTLNNIEYPTTVTDSAWSITVPFSAARSLSAGDNTVTATATDASGNVATAEHVINHALPPLTITLDNSDLSIENDDTTVTFDFAIALTTFDETYVTVDNGYINTPTTNNGGLTYTATYTPDAVVDATNTIKVNLDADDQPLLAPTTFIDQHNVSVVDNTITVTKEVPSDWGNSGAFSKEYISADGAVSWIATTPTSAQRYMFGLSNVKINNNHHYETIDYAIFLKPDCIELYEGGVGVTTEFNNSYLNGDLLSIIRDGIEIKYYNLTSDPTTPFYTSTVDSTGNLHVDMAFSGNGAVVSGLVFNSNTDLNLLQPAEEVAGSAESTNYTLATVGPTISIDNVSVDNIVTSFEAQGDIVITGTTVWIEQGQLVTLVISDTNGNKSYQATVAADGTWSVTLPGDVAQILNQENHIITADVSSASGLAATQATLVVEFLYSLDPLTITLDKSDLSIEDNATATVTFTFAEASTTFDATYVIVDNGYITTPITINGGSTYTATYTPYDVVDATNTIKVNLDANYQPILAPAISFTDQHNVSVVGNTITTTNELNDWGNSAAFSNEFISDNGAVSWIATEFDDHYQLYSIGLSTENSSDSFDTIEYSLLVDCNGYFSIVEEGVTKQPFFEGYSDGDVLSIRRVGTDIKYYNLTRSLEPLHVTSIDVPTGNLYVDTALFGNDTVVTGIVFNSDTSLFAVEVDSSAESANYTLVTVNSTITIDDVSVDNTVTNFEAQGDIVITGTTVGIEQGQLVTLVIPDTSGNKSYQATVAADGTWSVTLPGDVAQILSQGVHAITADVSSAGGVEAQATQNVNFTAGTDPLTITLDNSDLSIEDNTATVTFTFATAPTTFDQTYVTVDNGSINIPTTNNNGLTYTATYTPDAVVDATNTIKVNLDANDQPILAPTIFIDQNNVSVVDNTITVTCIYPGWASSAAFSQESISGDGAVSWIATTPTSISERYMFGLSDKNIDDHYKTIDYSIFLKPQGTINIFEKGADKGGTFFNSYSDGDVLSVRRVNKEVQYYNLTRDPTMPIYTSIVDSTGDLYVDMAFSSIGSVVTGVVFGSDDLRPAEVASSAESANYTLVTVDSTIDIDAVSMDNIVTSFEAQGDIMITGTTVGIEQGQLVTLVIPDTSGNGAKSYQATVAADGTWSVILPGDVAQILSSGVHAITADVSSAGGVEAQATMDVNFTAGTDPLTISLDKSDLSIEDNTAIVTFTFAIAPTTFDETYVTVDNGSINTPTTDNNGLTYTATYTPDDVVDATNTIKVNLDASGQPLAPTIFIDQNNVSVVGNTITATHGTSNWENSGTFSQEFISNNGAVSWSATMVDSLHQRYMVGLSEVNINDSFRTIDYGIYVKSDGRLEIFESDSCKGFFYNSYSDGDVLSIRRVNEEVQYYNLTNSVTTPFYISEVASTGNLYVDMAFYGTDAVVTELFFNSDITASVPAESDNYTLKMVNSTITIDAVSGDDTVDSLEAGTLSISGSGVGFNDGTLLLVHLNDKNYNAEVTDGLWSVTIPAADAIGMTEGINTVIVSATPDTPEVGVKVSTTREFSYSSDEVLNIVIDKPGLYANEDTATVTFTFKEAVDDFDLADVTAPNGVLSDLSSSDNITWTATFTPTADTIASGNYISVGSNWTYTASGKAQTTLPATELVLFDNTTIATDNNIVFDDNSITRATSTQTISSYGFVSTVINETNKERMFGLSNDNSGEDDIIYAFRLDADGSLKIVENGKIISIISDNYQNQDILMIERFNDTIVYKHNGETVYTSEILSTALLYVDVESTTSGATLEDITIGHNVAASTTSYAINTKTSVIIIDDISIDNNVYSNETLNIAGTVSNIENGQLISVILSGKTYQAEINGNTWLVGVPNIDVQTLSQGAQTVTARVSNAMGTMVTGTQNLNYDTTFDAPYTLALAPDNDNDGFFEVGETAVLTVTFKEAVAGLNTDSFLVNNGSLSNLQTTNNITWTCTFTPNADVESQDNKIVLVKSPYSMVTGLEIPLYNTSFVDQNNVNVVGNTITSTNTNPGWGTSEAFSQESISGDGEVSWIVTAPDSENQRYMLGLSADNISNYPAYMELGIDYGAYYYIDDSSTIEYAMYVKPDGVLAIYEGNWLKISFSNSYSDGDVLSVRRVGEVVQYYNLTNNAETPFYISEVASTGDLYVDMSFYGSGTGGGVTGLVFNSSIYDPSPVSYFVSTSMPLLNIDSVSTDNTIDASEAGNGFFISGTSVGVADDQQVSVVLNNVTYQGSVENSTWQIFVPQSAADSLIQGTNSYTATVSNLGGETASASGQFTYDSTKPLDITMSDNEFMFGETALVTFTFKSNVSDFDESDINVSNGILDNFSGSGNTYTATFTPTTNVTATDNVITVGSIWTFDNGDTTPAGTTNASFAAATNIRIQANNLTKVSSGRDSWDSGTFSNEVITGSGSVSTVVAETDTSRMIGLSTDDTNVSFATIDYATYLETGGRFYVYENGTVCYTSSWSAYQTGDVFSVARNGAEISYLKNGNVFYTSIKISNGDLHVDTALFTNGATLNEIIIDTGYVSASENYQVLTATPVISIDTVAGDNDISSVEAGRDLLVTGTATNVVEGGIITVSLGGNNYSAVVNDGVWAVTISLNDFAAGNMTASHTNSAGITADASQAVTYDAITPLVITIDDNALAAGETATVTFTFTEAVTGFGLDDISVGSGALSDLISSDNGKTWTATLTPKSGEYIENNVISVNDSWTYVSTNSTPLVTGEFDAGFDVSYNNKTTMVTGNNVVKIGGSGWDSGTTTMDDSTWESSLFTTQSISGNGSVSVTLGDDDGTKVFGLSYENDSGHYSSIDFAVMYSKDDGLTMYQAGDLQLSAAVTAAENDVIKMVIEDGEVTVLLNDTLIHTFLETATTAELYGDFALYSSGAAFNNIVMVDADVASSGNYEVDTMLEVTDMSVSGNALTITYNSVLSGLNMPGVSSFDIAVDDGGRQITDVNISGNQITVGFGGDSVTDTQHVDFSYTATGFNKLQDLHGGLAENIQNVIIGNDNFHTFEGTIYEDIIIGTDTDDVITGNEGNDILTGLTGSDTFDFNNLANGNGDDTIMDFQTGTGGDKIDISDLLMGYDGGTSDLADFVKAEAFSDTDDRLVLRIDTDGVVNVNSEPFSISQSIVLDNVDVNFVDLNTFVQDLYDDGNLVII